MKPGGGAQHTDTVTALPQVLSLAASEESDARPAEPDIAAAAHRLQLSDDVPAEPSESVLGAPPHIARVRRATAWQACDQRTLRCTRAAHTPE